MTFGPGDALPLLTNIDGAAAILPPMRFITANLNGVRSAASKGFFDWLARQKADAVGVQELKAQADVVEKDFASCGSLQGAFHYAGRRATRASGFTKETPSDVITGVDIDEFDREGRWVEKRFDKPRPQAQPDQRLLPQRQQRRGAPAGQFRFLDAMYPHLLALKAEREFILVADVNIAHKEIDLKNWRNQKNSGFLPEARLADALAGRGRHGGRVPHPQPEGRAIPLGARAAMRARNNVGWRLDYHLATPASPPRPKGKIYLDQMFQRPRAADHRLRLRLSLSAPPTVWWAHRAPATPWRARAGGAEALEVIAALRDQEGLLLSRFHAFGHDLEAHVVGDGDDGLDDGHVVAITWHIPHKALVDLDSCAADASR